MRLTSISITNMAAFASLETKLPAVAIIQGRTGIGKSSFLDCIKYSFGRGHNEDIIHGGAPEGEILIEFDNGAALRCRAVRDRSETTRAWRAPGSKRFVISREQIDSIASAISYDALGFMDKEEKEQIATLLRIMPIEVSHEELEAAAGEPIGALLPGNGIEKINTIHKQIYDRRREYNTGADAQEKHAGELEKSLPPPAPEGQDWNGEAIRIEKEKAGVEARQAKQFTEIRVIFEDDKTAAGVEYEDAVRAAATARDQRIEEGRRQANEAVGLIKSQDGPKLERLTSQLAVAQERARAIAQAEGTRKSIESTRADAKGKREASLRLTQALERLDKLKEIVAGRLPIKVQFENGRIVRTEEGKVIPFSRWNTSAKMQFCLRVAVVAHGEAGFICIDRSESFDSEKRAALIEAAEKYADKDGLQFLIATVSDTPLTISAPEREVHAS